jgi:hypothetical protein
MLRLILFITLLLALPKPLLGQGTVIFANSLATRLTTNTGVIAPPGQLPNQSGFTTGVNKYLIGLYTGGAGNNDPNSYVLRITATNFSGTFSGLFNGGSPATLPGVAPGIPIAFQIRAWTFTTGLPEDTFGAYFYLYGQSYYYGMSSIGYVTPGTEGSFGAQLFGTGSGQIGGFQLTHPLIPEPSDIALAVLGVSCFFLFRSRRQL